MLDNLVGRWAQERLFHGPLAVDAAAANQVWNAVTELRKGFSPKTAADASDVVDKWASEKFMNAPPLTHNTPAVNQLRAAIADLKVRFADALPAEAPMPPKAPKEETPSLPSLKSAAKE